MTNGDPRDEFFYPTFILMIYSYNMEGNLEYKNDKINKYNVHLTHDIASASDITPYNKIDSPLVVYRFRNFT